jgi:hypothetical protein
VLPVVAREEVGHLRRDEASELRPLPFDRLEQRALVSAIAGLVGERLEERNVLVGETRRLASHDDHDTDQIFLDHHRHAEHRAVRTGPGYAYSRSSSMSDMRTGSRVTAARPAAVVRSRRAVLSVVVACSL